MDNIYIYALMSDQYKYDISLTCMVLSLVYFTAKFEATLVEQLYSLININGIGSYNLKQIDDCKTFVMKKLVELGSKNSEIEYLDKQIDFNKNIGDAFKVSLILDK